MNTEEVKEMMWQLYNDSVMANMAVKIDSKTKGKTKNLGDSPVYIRANGKITKLEPNEEMDGTPWTQEQLLDCAEAASFMQKFKMVMWEKGFKGEKNMDEVAMEMWEYLKS